MVSDTDTLEVLKHLPRRNPCVKGNWLAQLGIPRLVKYVDDEDSCLSLHHLKCVPVGDAGAMYGFGFGADHTGCAVDDQLVVYHWAVRTWEQCTKTLSVVGLVYYEAGEVVFPPFLVKDDAK